MQNIIINNEYDDEIFENISIKNLNSNIFENCTFKRCIFNHCVVSSCKFVECTFDTCDLSLIKIKDSVFNDVSLHGCKAIGINWSNCNSPFNMNFYSSNLSQGSFYKLDLRLAEFISCTLIEVDFEDSNLEKAKFKKSDLRKASFVNTNLKESNFIDAKNYLINPNTNYIKNAKFSQEEALSFLNFLDIKII